MSWSEIMEKEIAGNYHEPGTLVEKREKMNSPSRWENQIYEIRIYEV